MPASSLSASAKAESKRVVFDSDDSSVSGDEGRGHGGDSLAREMAAAAERERRRNPHAETGRAKLPRTNPLASSSATTAIAPYKGKKMDLFSSDSSSSDTDDHEDDRQGSAEAAEKREVQKTEQNPREQRKAGAPPTPSPSSASSGPSDGATTASRSTNKVAHVQGLSFRAVKEKSGTETADDDADVLHINQAFATRYEEQKRKQELHALAEKYRGKLGRAATALNSDDDDEEDEDDAEEDEDAVLLTQENNLSFAKALLAVRKATVPLTSGTAKAGKDSNLKAGDGADTSAAGPALLLPKEELLKDRFFPPAEEQIRANTDIFERYVEWKRHGEDSRRRRFTLADEYARAVQATADSEDAVVDTAAEGGERDGLRKLRPQNAAEAKLRAAFLRDVEDSANSFEVIRGTKSNKAEDGVKDGGAGEEEEEEERRLQAARDEEKRLLEEAFSLSKSSAGTTKKKTKSSAEGESNRNEVESASSESRDDDAFLRDFFIQELWRPGTSAKKKGSAKGGDATTGSGSDSDEEGNGGSYYDRLAQLAREEEDEAFFNDAEVWEREYQEKKYRHQEEAEAAAAHVQTFPRPIGEAAVGLLRKPDTSRKDARQRRRERAEAARAQQIEELKRLKHLKRKEIEDQRALIASVAGLTVGSRRHRSGGAVDGNMDDTGEKEEAELAKLKAVWSDKDLDAPFDPAEFDRKMAQLFNDDYYDEKNVDDDEMAYFDEELDKEGGDDADGGDLDEINSGAAPALFAANSLEDAQAMLPAASTTKSKGKKGGNAEKFFDDAFGPQDGTSDALNLLYPSEALQALEKERQQLNELLASSQSKDRSTSESNEELLARLQASLKKKEEEYYRLHREAAADSGPAFRYREVEPEDFTLSIEEILALDDRQLNMIAPMNCYAAYLDKESNERDRRRIERRRQKGFREIASDRTSRRYGDVASTALLNPEQINAEEGAAIAANLAKRLREEGEDPDAPPAERAASRRQMKGPRREEGDHLGRGGRGVGRGEHFRGRGGVRGGFRGPHRGGGDRGRGGFRGGR